MLMCLCGAFLSCSKTTENIGLAGNNANYTIINKTTGEMLGNQGVYASVLGEGEVLSVKNGDTLELVFIPESKYQQYSWTVDFKLFNDEVVNVAKSPYKHSFMVNDVSPGIYYITCKASINDNDIQSTGHISGSVRVKIVE